MSKKTDVEVKFGFTASETKAKETTRDGMIVLQGDLSQDGTELNLFYDGHPVGGKGGGGKFGNAAGTAMELGGLGSSYSLNGKSDHQVLEDLLLPEYMPKETDVSASITGPETNGTVLEVGANTPQESGYTGTGDRRIMVAGTYSAASGSVSTDLSIKTGSVGGAYNTPTAVMGAFTVVNTVTVGEGNEIVKTNKGNPATKYSDTSDKTLYSSTGKSDHLISSGTAGQYYVAGGTATASHTIYYRYKVYASTATAGTLTPQDLTTAKSLCLTVKGGSLKIALPASYEDVEFAVETALSKISWDSKNSKYIGGNDFSSDNFVITEETKKLGDGVTNKTYKVYTYETGFEEGTKIRVNFTPKD